MRLSRSSLALLILSVIAQGQTARQMTAGGQITGTVMDQHGRPLQTIAVHAFREETRMYMPTVVTDKAGRFTVDDLEPGTYELFGENEAADYPNTALSFYSKEEPTPIALARGESAKLTLVLGPRAGVISGTVVDRSTGKPVGCAHAIHFIVTNVYDPEDSIEFMGPAHFRWLIAPKTEYTMEVTAEGYKTWSYGNPLDLSGPLPLQVDSGKERELTIELDPQSHR